jgi:hypothetical protein
MWIDDILHGQLQRRESSLSSDWTIWERKTLNMHRGVLNFTPLRKELLLSEITDAVREQVANSFRISWWRGFAFGVIIEAPFLPADVAALVDAIDTRTHGKGCWQRTIFACEPLKVAVGVHTWMEVALTPAFRAALDHFQSLGYKAGSFKKEKDRLMQFLTTPGGLNLPDFQP